MERTQRIAEKARALGFDLCGVAPAQKFPELEYLPEWLARGYAGEMRYLHNPKRHSPELVLPSARSVIACAMNYNTPLPYSVEARAMVDVAHPAGAAGTNPVPALHGQEAEGDSPRGWISRYAWGDDYHQVLGARLEKLVAWMREEFADPHESLWYVDTGPIVERVAAKWAGLGWLGKNTCLINEELGSWLFLGVVITTLELQPSLDEEKGKAKSEKCEKQAEPLQPMPDLCGQCTLCIDACPTGALVEPYVLDARRCISYLTIELRGPIPEEFHDKIGWHIFGCDICQDVCPYNRRAPVSGKPEFYPRAAMQQGDAEMGTEKQGLPPQGTLFAPRAGEMMRLSPEEFHCMFENSAIRRTKVAGLRRNAELAGKQSNFLKGRQEKAR